MSWITYDLVRKSVQMNVIVPLKLFEELVDDLECEIEARHKDTKTHPILMRRYERDMRPIKAARALLERCDKEAQ